jgi:hypothetical protein
MSKVCTKCHTRKPLTDFFKNSAHKTGYQSSCKQCYKEWRAANKDDTYYNTYYKREFGITATEYNTLLHKQNNVCKICGQKEQSKRNKRLAVDHCHTTGKVRGLLCSNCNRGVGLLKDNIQLLEKAIEYLKESYE